MFAIALAKFLGDENCEFIIAENTDYEACGCYHVGIKYKGRVYDGRGLTTIQAIKKYAYDESGSAKIVKLPVNDDFKYHVSRYTDWNDSWEKFYEIIQKLDKAL